MQRAVISLLVLPFLASGASAANRLNDTELDGVTAGQVLGIDCNGCTLSSSTSSSSNGVATTTNTKTIVGGGGGSSGGSNDGGGGGSGGGSGAGPGVTTSIPVPPRLAAILNSVSTTTVVSR